MRKSVQIVVVGALAFSGAALTGCTSSPEPKTEAKRESLAIDSDAAIKRMKVSDPSLQELLDKSHGYAVFPSIGKGGLGIGGTYGRGEVYQGGKHVGFADVTAISAGLIAGGQTISQLIVFATEEPFNKFTQGNWGFGANAAIVAMKAGAAKSAQFKDGVVTFVDTRGGLMGDLSLEGQKFRYVPASSPTTKPAAAASSSSDTVRTETTVRTNEEIRDPQRDAQPAAAPPPADRDPAIRGEVEVGPGAADKTDYLQPQPQGTSGQAGEPK
jgi:lipid-binding SYLF domain-containing protein